MSALLKVFVLREDRNAQALYAWLKQNWRAMAAAGKPLVVELKPEKTRRSLDQNARYWALVAQVAEQASVGGRQYSAEAWHELGSPRTDRVGLGLTTASPDDAARLLALALDATGASEACLSDDTVTTHAGALDGGWGVVLVAGTGVACLAVPEHGDPLVVDGHGYLLGDDGGGFWIGREGIRAALRFDDGRGPATALADAAREGGLKF